MEEMVVSSRLQDPPPPPPPPRVPCQIQLTCDRGPQAKNKNKREQHTAQDFSKMLIH